MIIFYPFFLVLPYIFYLIELFFPLSFFVEEVGKLILIYFILKFEEEERDSPLIILFGSFLFSFSESVFYLNRIILSGDFFLYVKRLFLTFLLHFLTFLVFYFLGKRYRFKGLLTGLIFNIIIHYYYNFYLVYGI